MKPHQLFALTAVMLLCMSTASPAQVMRERPNVKAPPSAGTGAPACAIDDKVEVTGFSLDPAQPQPGQAVTVRLTVKSKCPADTRPLGFQWDITDGADRKLGGAEAQLNPGASGTFTATWTAEPGAHKIRGDAYAQEATSGQHNNWREVSVTVSPKLVTQWLDRKSAKEAGADFTLQGAGISTCEYVTIDDTGQKAVRDKLLFRVKCMMGTGGKVDFEAYKGFTLKNGWKVKSHQVDDEVDGRAGWKWVTTPVNGSVNPYAKFHLWAEDLSWATVTLKIMIEGPEGTNPYQ